MQSLPTSFKRTTPFASGYEASTKLECLQLVREARTWKALHDRSVSRLQQLGEHTDRREAMLLAEQSVAQEKAMQREAALRAELDWS